MNLLALTKSNTQHEISNVSEPGPTQCTQFPFSFGGICGKIRSYVSVKPNLHL